MMTVISGKFACICCRKSKASVEESAKSNLCHTCSIKLKAMGIRTYGKLALIPCPATGCATIRRVSLGYVINPQFNPMATCQPCAQKRLLDSRQKQMMDLTKPKTTARERDPGCTIPRKKRHCRQCSDMPACIEVVYV